MARPTASLAPIAAPAQAVFLSPRVVDKHAFDELADALRTLIDHAAGTARDLQTAAVSAAQTAQQLEQASPRVEALLQAITGASGLLESRFAETAALLASATDRAEAVARFERHLDEIFAARLSAFQGKLAAAEAGARARIQALLDQALTSPGAASCSAPEPIAAQQIEPKPAPNEKAPGPGASRRSRGTREIDASQCESRR